MQVGEKLRSLLFFNTSNVNNSNCIKAKQQQQWTKKIIHSAILNQIHGLRIHVFTHTRLLKTGHEVK